MPAADYRLLTEATGQRMATALESLAQGGGGGGSGALTPADIADNLTTNDATKVLSAKQGKVLGDRTTALQASDAALQSGLAIIVDGDTASMAVPVGGYAYIRNNTHGLAEGLYKNTSSAAFPASGGTPDGTVFTAASGGGLNDIQQSTAIKTMALAVTTNNSGTVVIPNTTINPNTTIIVGIRTDGEDYCATYTIVNFDGLLAYKIKMWDTSGATIQIDANRTSNITVYYRNY